MPKAYKIIVQLFLSLKMPFSTVLLKSVKKRPKREDFGKIGVCLLRFEVFDCESISNWGVTMVFMGFPFGLK